MNCRMGRPFSHMSARMRSEIQIKSNDDFCANDWFWRGFVKWIVLRRYATDSINFSFILQVWSFSFRIFLSFGFCCMLSSRKLMNTIKRITILEITVEYRFWSYAVCFSSVLAQRKSNYYLVLVLLNTTS